MSSSFEKSVKGATKIKNAPPKTKYIEHILVATHAGEAGISEVFRALQHRLRDSTWTVVLKSLITVHLMIREGSPDVTLSFLAKHRNILSLGHFSDAQTQGRNVRHYANYLAERARAYRDTKTDWVRAPESRLEKLSVDKGLLRETEAVQNQLLALVKCDVGCVFQLRLVCPEPPADSMITQVFSEPENDITIAVFRLLVLDLLALFQVLNQGLINILGMTSKCRVPFFFHQLTFSPQGHFFEMSKTDAERAMDIYCTFTRQTDAVVQYLSVARLHEHHIRVEVPKLKHAPVNLGRQLEEYLKDPDFEIHRRQYLAEQDAKKKGIREPTTKLAKMTSQNFPQAPLATSHNASPAAGDYNAKPQANLGPDPDLIDFFDSIEQNQTPMQMNSQPSSMQTGGATFQSPQGVMRFVTNGFASQPTEVSINTSFQQQIHPSQQLQPNFPSIGFGGFMPQQGFQPSALGSLPQNSVADFSGQGIASQKSSFQPLQTPQMTNPFRQSLMAQQTGVQSQTSPFFTHASWNRQSTNPFARPSSSHFQSQPPSAAPLQLTLTGTNLFARNIQQQLGQTQAGIVPQPTGTTNPFRQGAFVNHATGMGWQHAQTPMGGGLDQLSTLPVFPRPAQQTPWQQ